MNSFFIQYNAPIEEYVKLANEIDSFRKTFFALCSF